MKADFYARIRNQLGELKQEGLYKSERVITTQQKADIKVTTGEEVLNFCANNYLGLANSPELIEESQKALDEYGFGMASVRFIWRYPDYPQEPGRAYLQVPEY